MPSPRRLRLLILAALTTAILILFYTSRVDTGGSEDGLQGFYHKTVHAMDGNKDGGGSTSPPLPGGKVPKDRDADGDVDADDDEVAIELQERLKAAEQKAKEQAKEKGGLRPDPPSDVVGVGSSAEGQDRDKEGDAGVGTREDGKTEGKTEEEREAESTLTSILKKSPGELPHANRQGMDLAPDAVLTRSLLTSHHLLQDVLPLLQAGKGDTAREVPHHAGAVRRRAGRASAGAAHPGRAAREDGPEDGAQHPHQRRQHRRQRRRRRDGQRRQAHVQDQRAGRQACRDLGEARFWHDLRCLFFRRGDLLFLKTVDTQVSSSGTCKTRSAVLILFF